MDYAQLKFEGEKLLIQHKKHYMRICQDQLHLKISEHELLDLLKREYLPIFVALKSIADQKQDTVFLGIMGVNGSGKTTLTQFLVHLLQTEAYDVIHFSMDDLYPTKATRLNRAKKIDPSLKTRLMYDNELVKQVLTGIKNWKGLIKIPRFDKAIDDRVPEEEWQEVTKKPDFVIMEGVFIFAQPIVDDNLSKADKFLNAQVRELADSYDFIDLKLVLLTDSIEDVIRFRQQQEVELKQIRGKDSGMTPQEVEAFIRYFQPHLERYTWPQERDPQIDLVFTMGVDRRIIRIISPKLNKVYKDS